MKPPPTTVCNGILAPNNGGSIRGIQDSRRDPLLALVGGLLVVALILGFSQIARTGVNCGSGRTAVHGPEPPRT
jgi:hypothetical protein